MVRARLFILVLLGSLLLTGLMPGTVTAADPTLCKQGGWQDLQRSDGMPFRNQGECVQYAARGSAFEAVGTIDLDLFLHPTVPTELFGVKITGEGLARTPR